MPQIQLCREYKLYQTLKCVSSEVKECSAYGCIIYPVLLSENNNNTTLVSEQRNYLNPHL